MECLFRFVLGGLLVCVFATIGDVLKPRGFAGLFGAAPSVAVASLALSAAFQGRGAAIGDARATMIGAIALLAYTNCCLYLMGRRHLKAGPVALLALPVWIAVAIGLRAVWVR
jgi:uncharacterized membrane protein (GlpM family)